MKLSELMLYVNVDVDVAIIDENGEEIDVETVPKICGDYPKTDDCEVLDIRVIGGKMYIMIDYQKGENEE